MATDNKYDRQLRLWGPEGQELLNTSRVCVLNSSGVSSEVLKNLVLPGIGFFTIIDDALVTDKDLGDNFFVTKNDIGRPRAEVVKSWLLELNPDVQGESILSSAQEVLLTPSLFKNFSIVIATQISFSQSRVLCKICEELNIKLVVAKSVGLLGYLRIYAKEHLVIESKVSDKEIFDLRLHKPFKELKEYADGIDVDSLEDVYHSHVPFIVILLKYLEAWTSLKGYAPRTYEEKGEFKEFIKSRSRNFYEELNFQEAVTKSYLCFSNEDLPDTVVDILNDPKSIQADSQSEDFWICAKSVHDFIATHNTPPVTGIFSDMVSDTSSYISMQNLYKSKSNEDYQEILTNYQRIKNTTEEPSIVRKFCRNIQSLEVTRINTIAQEMDGIDPETIQEAEFEEVNLLDWYFSLRLVEAFKDKHKRNPGTEDFSELLSYGDSLGKNVNEDVLEEVVRFGESEIHCISALIGGVGSQETIKLITNQYTPINNTFLYIGVNSTAQVLKL